MKPRIFTAIHHASSFGLSTLRAHSLLVLVLIAALAAASAITQRVSARSQQASTSSRANALSLQYTLSFPQPHTHLYEVVFSIGQITTPQIDLQMPTWTPGSYLQREFERNVQDFAARNEAGQSLRWEKVDKATWRVDAGGSEREPRAVRVSYRVYANELRTQTSHLDASHAYFNGTSVFMYVKGAVEQPLKLKINAPAGWRVTSPLALAPDADGFYSAPNYDILADSPTEIGTHKLLEFDVRGKRHRVALWGDGNYDEARLKEDLAKIVEQGALVFGGLPYEHYTFIVHLQPNIGGGTEHLNSTVCQASPNAFQPRRNYVRFLGLASHEYFHLWNVKRIRPQVLGPFDYQRENYTRALWLSEGVTSYYGDHLLRRAGLITVSEYLDGLASTMAEYEQTPGRRQQSAESGSFDTWIKHYRPDENSPNSALSYYTKGELLGWLLDFEIRTRTGGAKSLDDVMRYLYENYAQRGVGFPEAELKGVFEKVAGANLTDFFARYVSGTDEIGFERYLQMAGLQLERGYEPLRLLDEPGVKRDPATRGDLGLRLRTSGDRIFVNNVLAGMPGYDSGVNAHDELAAMDGQRIDASNIDRLLYALRPGQRVTLSLFRRERLMILTLTAAQKPPDRYTITPRTDANAAQRALRLSWLREEMKSESGRSSEQKE